MNKFAWLMLLTACLGGPSFVAVKRSTALPTAERPALPFSVGVARADVTPPPSAATFGHGPDAHLALGYWTRLECRAFFFSTGPKPEEKLAIIPCDLAAVGHLLQRAVAQKVRHLVPASRLMLTATHTHAGPAHYLESKAYGGATSSRWPGFDEALVDFLATRIAEAVEDAAQHQVPARMRWVHGEVFGLTRNRSVEAWRLNQVPWRSPRADAALPLDEQAVDPALDVLQLQRASDESTLGWLAFFAMHPTVLPATNRLFTGDVFGVTTRALERAVGGDAVIGFVNTNEGDIAPHYERPNMEETIRVGTALADAVLAQVTAAGPTGWVDTAAIDARWLELELDQVLLDGTGLCHAELGQGATRGAADHRSSIEHMSQDAPDSDRKDACGPRRKALGLLQDLIAGPQGFPTHVALAVARLGPVLVSFVPAEMTVTAGHVLDEVVLRHGPTADRALVAGLANAYIQYVATDEEFELQGYEGASTLYGRRTLALLARHYETLARSLRGEDVRARTAGPGEGEVDEVMPVEFSVATARPRLARPYFNESAVEVGHERRFNTVCRLRGPVGEPPRLCAVWDDVGPGRIWADFDDKMVLVRPWVSLRTPTATTLLDDTGIAFQVRTRGPACDENAKSWRWTARISPTLEDWTRLAGQPLVVHIASAASLPLKSTAFTADALPAMCDFETTRLCVSEAPAECP